MPIQPTYPGVYIEEIPSVVRTITGVPTSITAFVGRALRGPVNEPVTIRGFTEFMRIFGGLWHLSNLGYAVLDFFRNAPGGEAIIVRVYEPPPGDEAEPRAMRGRAQIIDSARNLSLVARDPGAWGGDLRVRVDYETANEGDTNLFNLRIAEVKLEEPGEDGSREVRELGRVEVLRNVSIDPASPRRVDKVLENESALMRWTGELPAARPPAQGEPERGHSVWEERAGGEPTSIGVTRPGDEGVHLVARSFVGVEAGEPSEENRQGLFALESADIFNLLVIPPFSSTDPNQRPLDIDTSILPDILRYVEKRRAMLILDPPSEWTTQWRDPARRGDITRNIAQTLGPPSKNAAVYFPRILAPDPQRNNQIEEFPPSGAVAGVMARTDLERGVWKAPAGLDATLSGAVDLSVRMSDLEIGVLNPRGINALRIAPAVGPVVWGARTREGDDRLASQWKYIPVRRLALFLEESLFRGTQWVIFEPNDEPLWAAIRLNVGAFMAGLFRQGAFQGRDPSEAYLVKCDSETTTQDDINRGVVNLIVGFAPLKPAEFLIIQIQQLAGQIQT